MSIVILKINEEVKVKSNFCWIFGNQVQNYEGKIHNGEIVKVLTSKRVFVGYGFLNVNSKIAVRLLSDKEEEVIDYLFFKKRIEEANELRKAMKLGSSYRVVFSESDFLPGLIIDKYEDILVISITSYGMELRKEWLIKALVEIFNPRGIYERSDMSVREKEGLPLVKGPLYGSFDTTLVIEENGLKLIVDIENGQKTGYFLDQKKNRLELQNYAKGKVVLDCFSHTGGFALNAMKGGAKEVMAVDISQLAVDNILRNAELNGFLELKAEKADVFSYLRREDIKDKYDIIVLDPPAFTKNKENVKKAYAGYKDINLQALKALKKGGILFTFSCSMNMTLELFMEMIKEASIDSKRKVRLLDLRIQSPDHPTLLGQEESLYLKCLILSVE